MQVFLTAISLIIWGVSWFFIVKYRGKRSRLMGNIWGAILGMVLATVFLIVISPTPTHEEKVAAETIRRDADASSAQSEAERNPVPSEMKEQLVQLYVDKKVYATNPVTCKATMVGSRAIVGCRSGSSAPHLWLYFDGKFYSLNGPASSLAGGRFANEPIIVESPLPLPADIDVAAIFEVFRTL